MRSKVRIEGPPKVALILPPCVPAGTKAVVEVHMDWGVHTSETAEFELVGAAQGAQVFSQSIRKGDGNVARY